MKLKIYIGNKTKALNFVLTAIFLLLFLKFSYRIKINFL